MTPADDGRQIRVGDWVRVVRNCDCHPEDGYGVIFCVEGIVAATGWNCGGPHWFFNGEPLAYGRTWKGDGHHPIAWLRRIPPLSDLETVRTHEEVEA